MINQSDRYVQMFLLIIFSYFFIQMLQVSEQDFMGEMGEAFVDFVGQYGYDRVLSVLGRHMRDFLNGKLKKTFKSRNLCQENVA